MPRVLRIAPFDRLGTPGRAGARLRRQARLRASRPRPAGRTLQGDRLTNVRPHPRQIHPGHHAPGHRRRRRRAAHQPAVLDVLPQDHRRSGPGARTTARRLPLADPRASAMARLGGGPGGHHRRGRSWTSSTTTSSRPSRSSPPRRRARAPCATSSRTPTTT